MVLVFQNLNVNVVILTLMLLAILTRSEKATPNEYISFSHG